jgi:hypothetical protein
MKKPFSERLKFQHLFSGFHDQRSILRILYQILQDLLITHKEEKMKFPPHAKVWGGFF